MGQRKYVGHDKKLGHHKKRGAPKRISPTPIRRLDMIKRKSLVAMAAVLGAWTCAAHAEDNLKIGIIATLSGPPAVLGQQLRNGFQLAVKDLGGKLGGREAEIF